MQATRHLEVIPLAGNMDFFSLGGPPAYQTAIGLGASWGSPCQNQYLGAPPIGLGSLGSCPAYKLPTCRQGLNELRNAGGPPRCWFDGVTP
jgi:hypothetical protein